MSLLRTTNRWTAFEDNDHVIDGVNWSKLDGRSIRNDATTQERKQRWIAIGILDFVAFVAFVREDDSIRSHG